MVASADVWSLAAQQAKAAPKQAGERPDAALWVVGARRAGKSTLVQRFLNADKSDAPKPTAHVEYTFGRRAAQGGADRKDVAHLWEVSGADELQAEFARADHAFLPLPTLATAVVVIALDLSQPNDCLPTLERWLRRLRERLDAAYERLRRRGSKLPDQLLSRARKLFGSAHEDRDAVQHFGVPVVVVANKYDAFQGQDVEMKKVLVRALRYFCHTHGASLIFTGGLERPVQGAMRTQLQHYRALLNHLVFHSAPLRVAEGDHNKPITVPAGADKLKAIGRPKGGGEGTAGWRQLVHQYFPPPEGAAKETRYAIDAAKYAEEDIDLLRQHKDAELASVLRQQQASAKAKAAKRRTARQ